MPERIADDVEVPTTCAGATRSTFESSAVLDDSASAARRTPGAIAPPTYSPAPLTQSNTVAVPRSTTMTAPRTRSNAASAFTIRSAPTSRGVSTRRGIPVRVPAPTTSGSRAKPRRIARTNISVSSGTTLAITAPAIVPTATPRDASIFGSSTAYSSLVRRRDAVRRSECTRRSPSNTPTATLVLPTSTASSSGSVTRAP